ncbi:MAG: hypothetical protein IJ880_00295 [Bacilli bacterium]|nr:hypothetical protein [Bacilli bacterium]
MVKKSKNEVKKDAIKFDIEVEKKEDKKVSKLNPKDLIGLTIKVNYFRTSCYLDRRNNIYIGLDGKGEYLIDRELADTEVLNQYLKAGNVFLFNGTIDVTKNFGGTAEIPKVTSRTPIFKVKDEFKFDKVKDRPFLDILSNNKTDLILSAINSFDLNSTKRLLELETRGYNNVRKGRAEVVDALKDRIKKLSK